MLFDEIGNIYPRDLIPIDISLFHERFVENFPESQTRPVIFGGYSRYLKDFSTAIIPSWVQWLNGSFTTAKVNPKDIDLVNFVPANLATQNVCPFLTNYGSKETYSVDGYLVPIYSEDDERFTVTKDWLEYWSKHFGHDRENNQKGILTIRHSL